MAYRVITEVRFTDQFNKLSPDEQLTEQVEALQIVTRNGGTISEILVVPSDQCAITIAEYADELSSVKAHIQIMARGAYELLAKRSYTLAEFTEINEAARAEAVVPVS